MEKYFCKMKVVEVGNLLDNIKEMNNMYLRRWFHALIHDCIKPQSLTSYHNSKLFIDVEFPWWNVTGWIDINYDFNH